MSNEADFDALPDPTQQVLPGVIQPQEVRIQDILDLAKVLEDLIEEEARLDAELSRIKERRKIVSEKLLPDAMSQIGMTEFRMANGKRVLIKPDVYCSAPEARMTAITAWLTEHNMASIIKTKPSIHPSTLKAFVKERLAEDPQFPRELFGVHEVQKAAISG